jgi:hypothetical protein
MSLLDREYNKFIETNPGEWSIRSLMAQPNMSPPENTTSFQVEETATSDIFRFYNNVTLLKTITINYFDSTKKRITSGVVG